MDQSAVIDLNRTCRMRKTQTRLAEGRLTRLAPLHPRVQGRWSPQLEDYKLCLRSMGLPFGLQDNYLDKDLPDRRAPSPELEIPEVDTDTDTESDDDDDDDDDGDDDDGDDDGNDDGNDDGVINDGGDEAVRRDRTLQYVRTQGGQICEQGNFIEFVAPDIKSEGGFVSHLSKPLQQDTTKPFPLIIIDDDDDDEIEIIPQPKLQATWSTPAARSRSRSILPNRQQRDGTTSDELFVTPYPDERSHTGSFTTGSPSLRSPSVMIDLTLDDDANCRPNTTSPVPTQGIKRPARIALSEPDEAKKRRMMKAEPKIPSFR